MRTDNDNARLAHALGICAKARGLIRGTDMICEALRGAQKPLLILQASDNSENTAKRLSDRASFYAVPIRTLPLTGDELARAIGKSGHAAAVAVRDPNFFRLLTEALNQNDHN